MTKAAKRQAQQAEDAPWDTANILTKYSLSFVWPLIRLAWRNELEFEDLPKTPRGDLSRTLGERLERSYQLECELAGVAGNDDEQQDDKSRSNGHGPADEQTKREDATKRVGRRGERQPSLIRALFSTFGWQLLQANLFNTFVRCFVFPLQTVALGWILTDIRRYINLKLISDIFVDQASELPGRNLTEFHVDRQIFVDHHYEPQEQYLMSLSYDDELQTAEQLLASKPELEREHLVQRIMAQLFVLVSCTILASCLLHPFYFQTYHLGMKLRVATCHMIYKKALRLSQRALGQASAGQMINLLSNDVNRFDRVCESVPFLFDGPCQVIIITFILSKHYVGLLPTLAGLLLILLMMLFQGVTGKFYSRYREETAKMSDERVRLMSELLQAIRVIKMYAWERPFQRGIERARSAEMRAIRKTIVVRALNYTIFYMSSKIIVAAILFVYIILDYGSLDPELIFVTIGLSNLIRLSITLFMANAVAVCSEAAISCERISHFLQLPEIEPSPRHALSPSRQQLKTASGERAIRFERAYAWWTNKQQMVLRNLSLTVEPGQFVLLVGRVGSGKSSVLMSLLGELPLAGGRLEIGGRLSYASQEPWLFAGTARDNILFGEPFEAARYQEVVRVCCLERDFKELLRDGDQTMVGERGAALSGGQKARLNLARALYRQADIYLLDDPLSAVDAPVAKHIVREALAPPHGFLAHKTVLLATHQLQVLRQAQRVLLVDQQAPAMFGTVEDIFNSSKFTLIDYGRQELEDAVRAREKAPSGRDEDSADQSGPEPGREAKGGPVEGAGAASGDAALENMELDCGIASDKGTYMYYLRNSFQPPLFVWFLFTMFMSNSFYVWIDFMLSRWTDAREQLETLGDQIYQPQNFIDRWPLSRMMNFYALSLALGLLATLLFCLTFAYATLRASRLIHKGAVSRLFRARQSYFDCTPIGVVLNRLSRDLGFVDQTFPQSSFDMILISSNVFVVMALTIIISPYNGLVAVALCTLAGLLRSAALRAITRLKQIEGITRSPVVSHLSTTLDGLATIRAFGAQQTFSHLFDRHQDDHSAAWFAFICATRWLGQAMDWSSTGFVSVVMIGAVALRMDSLSASLLGLLLSQCCWMPGAMQAAMRQLVESESQMTSVQRLKELNELEVEAEEAASEAAGARAARREPCQAIRVEPAQLSGCIKFVDVTLRYKPDGPATLRRLSLLIRPRERIGIVGRTGAGKSSLIGILFRLYHFEGRVELDGRDTRSMPLAELRAALGIIPQEPVLFAGSLRHNLDPFGRHADSELWRALEVVRLGSELFARQPDGLEFPVGEGGANFSLGQRQLLCLARAIVARKRILVLDEATANVDPETDQFIQRTIREQFADCTVLTIAHRLNTIADSHRVLVLDRGQVAEFGEPHELLKDESGIFSQMVASSSQQAPRLRRLFEESHERRASGQLQ